MGIQLYEHNRKAYEAALAMMEEEGMAAVIHPTGTGKSFIAFKLAEDHPDARICWLVPGEYIYRTQLENLIKMLPEGTSACSDNILFWSYSKLMKNESKMGELHPDYIVLDEFHRCGAAEWGRSVHKLLEMYPDAKVLGLSATNIRYLDQQRDMAQELFHGNIASELTLGEAMAREILPMPKYVLSMYSYQKELKKLEYRVRASENKGLAEQNQSLLELLRRALEQADGLDQVFAKHMEKQNGKYIVFCADKEHMDEMKTHVQEWFHLVDKAPHVYSAYYNSPETSREFQAFQKDESGHLKLLFSINMLNEGVHVEGVDGVILLRPTVSPIIYLQQIGRSLSAGTSAEPVIFDLVNNFDSLYCIDFLREELEEAFILMPTVHGKRDHFQDRFRIIDEVRDCRLLFRQLQENLSSSWETYYLAARAYHLEHGDLRIPKSYVTSTGLTLGSWIGTQRRVYAGKIPGQLTEEQIQKLNGIGMIWNVRSDIWEEGYRELLSFYRTYGHADVKARYVSDSGFALGRWINNLRTKVKKKGINAVLSQKQQRKLEELGMIWDKDSEGKKSSDVPEEEKKNTRLWNTKFQLAKEYYEQHGNLDIPVAYCVDGIKLGRWISNIRVKRRRPGSSGMVLDEGRIRQLDSIGMNWK